MIKRAHRAKVFQNNVSDGDLVHDTVWMELFFEEEPFALLQLLVVPHPLDLGARSSGHDHREALGATELRRDVLSNEAYRTVVKTQINHDLF